MPNAYGVCVGGEGRVAHCGASGVGLAEAVEHGHRGRLSATLRGRRLGGRLRRRRLGGLLRGLNLHMLN